MRRLLAKIIFRIVECERIMKLLSRAMDSRLGICQRLAIRMHCWCCPGCSTYELQLPFLREAMQRVDDEKNTERIAKFSTEDKQRLVRFLKSNEPPPE
ncbi:MAG: hypothetical protein ACJAQZ_004961 [Planctomycetota bacterium]|jgi:hypothetical protein